MNLKYILKFIGQKFIPSVIWITFPILWATYNYELFYLLNDEVIFDGVLFLILLALHTVNSSSNFKSDWEFRSQSVGTLTFIFYYLITSRYLILRQKKYQGVNFIELIRSLDHIQSVIFDSYTTEVHKDTINLVKDKFVAKLNAILIMKHTELVRLVKQSYSKKLFVLI